MANSAVSRTEGSGMRMRMFSINNYSEEGRKGEQKERREREKVRKKAPVVLIISPQKGG